MKIQNQVRIDPPFITENDRIAKLLLKGKFPGP